MDKLDIPHIFDNVTWQAALADYLHNLYDAHSKSLQTVTAYTYYLKRFFSKGKPIENYTRRDVEDFLRSPCRGFQHPGAEPSTGTKRLRLCALKSFYNWCENYTIEGPDGRPQRLLQVVPPTAGVAYTKRVLTYKAMSLSEVQRFFAAIPQDTIQGIRDYCIFTFYLYTLRRRAEIARLTWGDITQGTIRDEHGNTHEGWLYQWTGKGDAGEMHMIELPKPCVATLMRWLEASGRIHTVQPADPLFVPLSSWAGHPGVRAAHKQFINQPLSASTIARNFKYIAACAGLDPKFSVHSLRHSGIQLRIMSGQEITDIMKVSSHKSLDSFMTYARRLNTADTGATALEQRLNLEEKKRQPKVTKLSNRSNSRTDGRA